MQAQKFPFPSFDFLCVHCRSFCSHFDQTVVALLLLRESPVDRENEMKTLNQPSIRKVTFFAGVLCGVGA